MSDSQDAMLTGLKVLDCGENVSAPYAAKLMADKKSTHFVQPVKEPIEEKKEDKKEK